MAERLAWLPVEVAVPDPAPSMAPIAERFAWSPVEVAVISCDAEFSFVYTAAPKAKAMKATKAMKVPMKATKAMKAMKVMSVRAANRERVAMERKLLAHNKKWRSVKKQ